jgi:hypothetical protein
MRTIADCGLKGVRFVTLAEMEKAVRMAMGSVDLDGMVRRAVEEAWGRVRGRV